MTTKKTPFSDLVGAFATTGDASEDLLDAAFETLRTWTYQHLKSRGLLNAPPRYLDVTGVTWTTPHETATGRSATPGLPRTALDELTWDCFDDIFGERLTYLLRCWQQEQDQETGRSEEGAVEAQVGMMLRQILTDRQRRTDRLGSDVYNWVRTALAKLVDGGQLHILRAGRPGVLDNSTVLGSEPNVEPQNLDVEEETAALVPVVSAWIEPLLENWLTVRGSGVRFEAGKLEPGIQSLPVEGFSSFSFKALVDAVKIALRQQLAARWPWDELPLGLAEPEPDEAEELPDALARQLARERFEAVANCVERGIKSSSAQKRTRDHELKLWRFVMAYVLVASDYEMSRVDSVVQDLLASETFPSYRRLGKALGIPRDRFSDLMSRLKTEVERCREEIETAFSTDKDDLGNNDERESNMHQEDRRQQARKKMAMAYRASLAKSAGRGSQPGNIQLGNTFHLQACPEPGIEWLLLEIDSTTNRGLLVPTDGIGWVGSSDVAVADVTNTTLSAHCGHGLWIELDDLRSLVSVNQVGEDSVEKALTRRRLLQEGDPGASDREYETDADPEYLAWRGVIDRARDVVQEAHRGTLDQGASVSQVSEARPLSSVGRPPRTRLREHLPMAASIIVAFGAGWFFSLRSSDNDPNIAALEQRISELQSHVQERTAALRQAEEAQVSSERQLETERERFAEEQEVLRVQQEREINSWRERLRILSGSEIMPWKNIFKGIERGAGDPLLVPEDARSIGLAIEVNGEGRMEIRDAEGQLVYGREIVETELGQQVFVRVTADLMPPGAYEIVVWEKSTGGEKKVTRQGFLVERP